MKTKTMMLCYECIPKDKYCYRIGGTWQPDICQQCGKEDYLGEYVFLTKNQGNPLTNTSSCATISIEKAKNRSKETKNGKN